MTAWEYGYFVYPMRKNIGQEKDQVTESLNQWGSEGWEAVHYQITHDSFQALMKRERVE